MATATFLLLTALAMFVDHLEGREFVRLCYFTSWTNTHVSILARFDLKDVDPLLCTHLVYAFASIDRDTHTLIPKQGEDDGLGQKGRYRRFTDLKKQNPSLKTLLSVGGENAATESFLTVTRGDDAQLKNFGRDTVALLRKFGFDGLDVDWEFPNATTKDDYLKLLKTLRGAFDEERREGRLLLTVALSAGKQVIDPGYDVANINRYVDLANLMTYDYYGKWSSVTGFDSPLYSQNSQDTLSTDWTVKYYRSLGLAAEKIVVGVTAAGTWLKLQNDSVHDVGAPVIKDLTLESDIWKLNNRYAYPEICRLLQNTHALRMFDETQQVPYAVLADSWIGYEDPTSLEGKVDYMLKEGLAGAMFWSLDLDDFSGKFCDAGKYPLLRALSRKAGSAGGRPLTPNVNPNIRYLTKYRGGAAVGPQTWNSALKVFCGVVGVAVVVSQLAKT